MNYEKRESVDEKLAKVNGEITQILDDWKSMSHDALKRVDNYEKIKARLEELKLKEVKRSFTEYAFCRYCRFLDRKEYTKRLLKEEDFKPLKQWGYFCVLKNQPTEQNRTCAQFAEKGKEVDGEDGKTRT